MKRAALILGVIAQASVAQVPYISVRATTGVTPEAERKLTELAEPLVISVPAGADPIDAVRQVCGRVTPTYLELLKQRNSALARSERAQTIHVPACFVVKPNALIAPLEGERLEAFAARTVGVSGSRTLDRIKEMNSWIAHLSAVADPLSSVARPLTVPFATEGAMYRLKAAAAANPQTAAADLEAILGATPGAVAVSPELRLESDIDPAKSVPVACPAASQVPNSGWPFDPAALAAVIARNDAFRAKVGMKPAEPAIVAVADNGVDGLGTIFPAAMLTQTPGEVPNDNKDNDGDKMIDDVYGANVETHRPPYPLFGKDRWHGTHLAGIVLGLPGIVDAADAAVIGRRIRLLPISMVQIKTTGSLQSGNVTSYVMPPDAVEHALSYAMLRGAKVINLSISTDDELKPLQSKLAANPPILMVAAAGNLGTNFAAEYRYPAAYGGSVQGPLRFPVIAVAAHDRLLCLNASSGRGQMRVDLAAPGADIRSTDIGGGTRLASGTSQATALVSFAAGLLSSEGIEDPLVIKQRLIASTDPRPGLKDYVFAGGALDIVKALSLYDDLIELPTGELLRVEVAGKPSLSKICPAATSPGDILKISSDGAGALRVLVHWSANGALEFLSCPNSSETISYTDAGGGHSLPLSNIDDLVFRN